MHVQKCVRVARVRACVCMSAHVCVHDCVCVQTGIDLSEGISSCDYGS